MKLIKSSAVKKTCRRQWLDAMNYLGDDVPDFDDTVIIVLLDVDVIELVALEGDVVLIPGDFGPRIASDGALETHRFADLGDFVVRQRVELGRRLALSSPSCPFWRRTFDSFCISKHIYQSINQQWID